MADKWEAKVTIPTGNWTFQATDGGGGPVTITLTATNTYYPSSAGNDTVSLLAKIKALLDADATLTGTYTVSLSDTTGKVTISVDSGTFSITWTSTDLRDLLGFTGNISSQATATGANQCEALWMSGCPPNKMYGLTSSGRPIYDRSVSVASDGTYAALVYASQTRDEISYEYVVAAKTLTAQEATVNEAFQTFYDNAVAGNAPWSASPGEALRWHKDLIDDATYLAYNILGSTEPEYSRLDATWDGAWVIRVPVLAD